MKTYVAASSTELERASAFMQECRFLGCEITLDWVQVIRDNGGVANAPEVPLEVQRAWSQRDLAAVDEAKTFILLCPLDGAPARGAFVELGYAVARGKRTIVVRSPACYSMFQSLATFSASSDSEALAILRAAKRTRVL